MHTKSSGKTLTFRTPTELKDKVVRITDVLGIDQADLMRLLLIACDEHALPPSLVEHANVLRLTRGG